MKKIISISVMGIFLLSGQIVFGGENPNENTSDEDFNNNTITKTITFPNLGEYIFVDS